MTWKRRTWLILLACVAVAITLFALLPRNSEPQYEGRPLSEWVLDLSPVVFNDSADTDEARAAIRAIGPQAIPHLLEYHAFELDTSIPRNVVRWLLDKFPSTRTWKWSPTLYEWAYLGPNVARSYGVPFALEALGPAAAPAIPELEQLMEDSSDPIVYWKALNAFAAISTDAQPILLSKLSSSDPYECQEAATAYGIYAMLQTNAMPAVPLLLQFLQDSNVGKRYTAAWVLGEIDVPPELVVPSLTKTLNDPDPTMRDLTTNTLLRIAPEVLTNAPPE